MKQDTQRPGNVFAQYHAHVYFDEKTVEQARKLCESAAKRFGVAMGRVHRKPVGPHPRWSCQLAFDSAHLTPAASEYLASRLLRPILFRGSGPFP